MYFSEKKVNLWQPKSTNSLIFLYEIINPFNDMEDKWRYLKKRGTFGPQLKEKFKNCCSRV